MAKKKQTPNQQQWKKELRRLKRFIRNAEKRGFKFDENVIPETPKRITQKRLNEIKQLKPNKLYEEAKYFDRNTGDVVSGSEGRRRERSRASQKAYETRRIKAQQPTIQVEEEINYPTFTDTVLSNVEEMIAEWEPSYNWSNYWINKKGEDRSKLMQILNEEIAVSGRDAVAERLQASSSDIERIINAVMYGSQEEQTNFALVEFAQIIRGRNLSFDESAELTLLSEAQEEFE